MKKKTIDEILRDAESCPYCGLENPAGILEYPEDAEGVWHVWWGQGDGGEFCDKHVQMLACAGAYIYSSRWEQFEE